MEISVNHLTILPLFLVASFASFSVDFANAQASAPDSYQQYRCIVLGDTNACQTRPLGSNAIDSPRMGSYATYLSLNGMEKSEALKAAAAIGERPVPTAAGPISVGSDDRQYEQSVARLPSGEATVHAAPAPSETAVR
jgi:hypothetical protein